MIVSERQFVFKLAVRENTPMIIGISGASGSGKTFTALELAMGLAGKGKILFIDTEGRRGLHYADLPGADGKPRFFFDHCDFTAPFPPQDFLKALKDASRAGYAVIIVDTFSEEYTGEGGITEMADAELKRMKNPNAIAAWARPKAAHKMVVGWLRQSRSHVILCLRADEKIKLDKANKPIDNSNAPPIERWVPICERRLPYELTTSFLLTPDKPGVPHPIKLQEQHKAFFPLDRPITRQTGERLAAWCAGGAPSPVSPPAVEIPPFGWEIGELTKRTMEAPESTRDGSGQLDSDITYGPPGDPFDPSDPFGFGDYPDDHEVVDGLPLTDIDVPPERLNAAELPADLSADIGKVDGVPQQKGGGEYYTQAEVDKIAELPEPHAFPSGSVASEIAERITELIPTLDAQDCRDLRNSMQMLAIKNTEPMTYAKVLGQLIDRERALQK